MPDKYALPNMKAKSWGSVLNIPDILVVEFDLDTEMLGISSQYP